MARTANRVYAPPPHFTRIGLTNFRGFRKEDIPLAPLTFLVGPNSSGKSSVFSAMMLTAQSNFIPHPDAGLVPNWNGALVDLGSFEDAVYRHKRAAPIGITLQFPADLSAMFRGKSPRGHGQLVLDYTLRAAPDDPIGRLHRLRIADIASQQSITVSTRLNSPQVTVLGLGKRRVLLTRPDRALLHMPVRRLIESAKAGGRAGAKRLLRGVWSWEYYRFTGEMQRVASGRAAPKRWYPLGALTGGYGAKGGLFDEVNPSEFYRDARKTTFSSWRRAPGPMERKYNVASILESLQIATEISASRLSPYHSAVTVQDSITDVRSNLIDVGYGASQVIPVISACLYPSVSPLCVEEPEIHLHPKAQGTIAQLLCDASRYRQVIVETHSVHMINRARILVARGELPKEHVTIHYVSRNRSGSHVTTIPLKDDGDFAVLWPEGFFDERYQDTLALMALKGT